MAASDCFHKGWNFSCCCLILQSYGRIMGIADCLLKKADLWLPPIGLTQGRLLGAANCSYERRTYKNTNRSSKGNKQQYINWKWRQETRRSKFCFLPLAHAVGWEHCPGGHSPANRPLEHGIVSMLSHVGSGGHGVSNRPFGLFKALSPVPCLQLSWGPEDVSASSRVTPVVFTRSWWA